MPAHPPGPFRSRLRTALAGAVAVATLLAASPASAQTTVEAEALQRPTTSGQVFADAAASGGAGLLLWSNATASGSTSMSAGRIVVRARGDQCSGAPRMVVRVNDKQILSASVSSPTSADHAAVFPLTAVRSIKVSFTNDYRTKACDRNLRLDRITLAAPASANPLAAAKLYVDPFSSARRQVEAWASTRPAEAAEMEKIASRSHADWFGGWSGDISTAVNQRVTTITSAGALPVLVAYNIPQRDCGGYSAGGVSSATAYRSWIAAFAAGIGDRPAVVILEPDALAAMDCLSIADQGARVALLKDAVDVLEARPNVSVYLDAGHSRWRSVTDMAARLTNAGVGRAQGFSLNVSNYNATSDEVSYARSLSSRLGGKHGVIDTSRNGLGPSPDGQWCNAPGRALGPAPGSSTVDASIDAYLWIKRPGESDGTCNGGPPAGAWWPDYALGLAQRAR
jgi:endoglucanase